MVNTFKERHDFLLHALLEIKGVECPAAQGAFYLFPNLNAAMERLGIKTDIELGEVLLEKAGVALVPGSAFGAAGHMRFSFATSMDNLKKAVEKLHTMLD
jgi:aspartate aminotransferase